MIGQNDGIKNENNMVSAFNNKQIARLTTFQKAFINSIFPNINESEVIRAKKIGGQGFKPDLEIIVANRKYNISIKKGGGNSVHQEKTALFIEYCTKYLDMTQTEKNSLLKYLYGDGTIDGNSIPENRLADEKLLRMYAQDIKNVQQFLDRNKKDLVRRFLVYGRKGYEERIKADYLYHGDSIKGVWCSLDEPVIEFISNMHSPINAPLTIGPLTLQVWNRNLSGKPNMENRRHSIQIKWASCKYDITKINRHFGK